MATVLKAGAIKIDLEANAKNLIQGFKNAVSSLDAFGKSADKQTSSSKRLDDQLKSLERRKQLLTEKMKMLEGAGKSNTTMYQTLGNQLSNVSDRIQTQNLRITEYNNKLGKSSGILGVFGNALSSMGRIGTNAIQGLASSINRIAEITIGNVLANAISRATNMLLNFAKTSFGLTTDLQDTRGGFEAMLGSAEKAQDLLVKLSEYNKKTPFQLPQLQEQSANLLAIGVSADKIIPTLDMLGKISRGNANRLGFLTLAYGQVQSATKLTGAELRQFTENGVPLLELLAKQTGKSTAVMREEISDGAVSFAMVDKALQSTIQEGGRFYNYFEKQGSNFSFVTSNIIDNFQQIGRSIMGITEAGDIIPGGIFDRVTQEAQEFLKWINENRQSIIELGNNFINFGLKVGRAIMSIPAKFQQFLDLLSDLKKRVDEVGLAIATYFKPEIEALTKIFDFFIQNILPYIISSLAILAGVLVWIGANIITALIYAWEQLREPVMQFALALMEVWAGVSPVIAVILGLVAVLIAVLVPVLQIVWSYVVQVFSGILQVITGVINLVIGIIKAGIGLIYGIFTGDFRMAGEGFKQIWMGLIQFVSGIWTMMKAHVVAIIDGIKSTFKSIDLIQAGKDAIQGFINGIGNMAGALKEKVEGLANTVKNGIKDALKIKSPSRVMMDVGMDTGAGLELGLENSKGNIETQVNSISDLIISGFDGTNTNTQTQTTNMTNNFNVSGAQNPQTIINELMRQLARMNNLANSGVGQAI